MSEVLLLYLFTRLDSANDALAVGALASLLGCALLGFYIAAETLPKEKLEKALVWLNRMAAILVTLVCLLVLLPNQKEAAIIIGGKVALDAIRTPEAKEIGQDVLNVVRKTLKEASK